MLATDEVVSRFCDITLNTTMAANSILPLLQQRNSYETTPFVAIHRAYSELLQSNDFLEQRCRNAELQVSSDESTTEHQSSGDTGRSTSSNAAARAALQHETKLREHMEQLEQQLQNFETTAKDLADAREQIHQHEQTIKTMTKEQDKAQQSLQRITEKLEHAQSDGHLAETQGHGLKRTIRTLQNDLKKQQQENQALEKRLVKEQEKTVQERMQWVEQIEQLQREVKRLTALLPIDAVTDVAPVAAEKTSSTSSWFGLVGGSTSKKATTKTTATASTTPVMQPATHAPTSHLRRQAISNAKVVPPTKPLCSITAHQKEGTCLFYDPINESRMVTCSLDGSLQLWSVDSSLGSTTATVSRSQATLYTAAGHSLSSCDVVGLVVAGVGTEHTGRIWHGERMIHQLVGHEHRLTSIRLLQTASTAASDDKPSHALSASADRTLRVWDISRTTYHQVQLWRHSSVSHGVDVQIDGGSIVSGHQDGGVRFWDLRSSGLRSEIKGLHHGGITSVHWNPSNPTLLLTNGMDSVCKVVDIRTYLPLHTFQHEGLKTVHNGARSVFSPNGKFVALGSQSGVVWLWNLAASSDSQPTQLKGHTAAVCGIDWKATPTGGQQVATLDRKGTMILWT